MHGAVPSIRDVATDRGRHALKHKCGNGRVRFTQAARRRAAKSVRDRVKSAISANSFFSRENRTRPMRFCCGSIYGFTVGALCVARFHSRPTLRVPRNLSLWPHTMAMRSTCDYTENSGVLIHSHRCVASLPQHNPLS